MRRRTTIVLDEQLLAAAQAELGTSGVSETVEAALQDSVRRHRRQRLAERLRTGKGLDLELLSDEGRRAMWQRDGNASAG